MTGEDGYGWHATVEDKERAHWFRTCVSIESVIKESDSICGKKLTPAGSARGCQVLPGMRRCTNKCRLREPAGIGGAPDRGRPAAATKAEPGRVPPSVLYKNEGTTMALAIVLGIFICHGVGHIYVGRTARGVVLLVSSILLAVIGGITLFLIVGIPILIGVFVMFIWLIFDARKLCRQYNEHLSMYGRPPW